MDTKRVTVIGSGMVGSAWAALFARKYHVCLFDTDPARVESGLKDTKTKLATLEEAKLLDEPLETIFGRVSTASNLKDALKGAFYVQECVPEVLDIKLSVWKELDQEADPTTILGSSTSNMPASKFTENLTHRERCLVAHPVNPPHLVKLVEIVPTPWTKPEVVQKTRSLMEEIGQKPVVLNKEANGFALNRLQYAILGECFRMVQEGVLSPGDVDTTLACGLAPRWAIMGAFQTIDLNAPKGVEDYCTRYLAGLTGVLKEQDNQTEITPETIQKISDHQRALYPVEEIPQVTAWRDARLTALLCHTSQECQEIDKMFPSGTK